MQTQGQKIKWMHWYSELLETEERETEELKRILIETENRMTKNWGKGKEERKCGCPIGLRDMSKEDTKRPRKKDDQKTGY